MLNPQLAMNMACNLFGLTPEEAIAGMTVLGWDPAAKEGLFTNNFSNLRKSLLDYRPRQWQITNLSTQLPPTHKHTSINMSDSTFHMTKEDIRKPESKASQSNSGNVPADSDAAKAQSIVDSNTQSKADLINERVAGLPKPEQPPVASDFNSADASIAKGSGAISGTTGQTGPETAESSVRVDGDALKTNTAPGPDAARGTPLPNDAVAQGSKQKADLANTTN